MFPNRSKYVKRIFPNNSLKSKSPNNSLVKAFVKTKLRTPLASDYKRMLFKEEKSKNLDKNFDKLSFASPTSDTYMIKKVSLFDVSGQNIF